MKGITMVREARQISPGFDDYRTVVRLLRASKSLNYLAGYISEDVATETLPKLIGIKNNEFSTESLWVYCVEGKIVAVIQMFMPEKIDPKVGSIYRKALNDKDIERIYKKWADFVKPMRSVYKNPVYIYCFGCEPGLEVEASKAFFKIADDFAAENKSNAVYTDVANNDEETIQLLKDHNFKPVRVVDDDQRKVHFVRLVRDIPMASNERPHFNE